MNSKRCTFVVKFSAFKPAPHKRYYFIGLEFFRTVNRAMLFKYSELVYTRSHNQGRRP